MRFRKSIATAIVFVCLFGCQANAQSLGTKFTYQGRLSDNGQPANGNYSLNFRVYTSQIGGTQVGGTQTFSSHPVEDGLFTVELDFGPAVYNDNLVPGERWLEISVEQDVLTPRQPFTGSPYSIQTRGLEVREDSGGMRVGVGSIVDGFASTLGVYSDATDLDGMTVETAVGGSPTYAYKSGNDQSVYHYLDTDDQAWRLHNSGDRIFVGSDGFVGINKDTKSFSSEMFGVYRPTTSGAGIIIEADDLGDPYFGFATGGELRSYMAFDDDDKQWKLLFRDADTGQINTRVWVNPAGNMGIGFSQPSLRLMVNGDAGKPGGGSWSNVSDRRLKKNIAGLENSLDTMLKLRGVNFEYNDPKAIGELGGVRMGVIAQEVEKVFPDWVGQRNDGYKHVTFRGFEALTVEAIRELRDENDDAIKSLKIDHDRLQAENELLRNRLDAMEEQLQQLMSAMNSH